MNHCKDCRFWDRLYAGLESAECLRLRIAEGYCRDGLTHTTPDDQIHGFAIVQERRIPDVILKNDMPLITTASFGCVHFEAKERQGE